MLVGEDSDEDDGGSGGASSLESGTIATPSKYLISTSRICDVDDLSRRNYRRIRRSAHTIIPSCNISPISVILCDVLDQLGHRSGIALDVCPRGQLDSEVVRPLVFPVESEPTDMDHNHPDISDRISDYIADGNFVREID